MKQSILPRPFVILSVELGESVYGPVVQLMRSHSTTIINHEYNVSIWIVFIQILKRYNRRTSQYVIHNFHSTSFYSIHIYSVLIDETQTHQSNFNFPLRNIVRRRSKSIVDQLRKGKSYKITLECRNILNDNC